MPAMRSFSVVTLGVCGVLAASVAFAQPPAAKALRVPGEPESYWTPERIHNAVAMPLPMAETSPEAAMAGAETSGEEGAPASQPGRPPLAETHALSVHLFTPDAAETVREPLPLGPLATLEKDAGRSHAYFSSTRLVPESAVTFYPYSAVGKLFFTIPGQGDFLCSGSVINARIVLTAGHCVHSGNGAQSGFYTHFMFVPAYLNGDGPAGRWAADFVFVTNAWYTGKGTFPNASDFAMLEIQDDSLSQRIGDVTGFLGWITQSLMPNHATLLGYPVNLDNGEHMHQVNSGSFQRQLAGTITYGSDMGPGSSGGPWVQNFGKPAVGQNVSANQVIGVTSYGPKDTTLKYQGSSTPDRVFTSLISTVCGHQAGNCN